VLQPQDGVEQQEADEVYGQEGEGVARPVLACRWIDARRAIEELLHRVEHPRKRRRRAGIDQIHVNAHQRGKPQDERSKEDELQRVVRHGRSLRIFLR
jgi:hypothetical protein